MPNRRGCAIIQWLSWRVVRVVEGAALENSVALWKQENPYPLKLLDIRIWSRYRIPAFSPLFFSPVSSRKSEGDVEVNHHGELSEWSKVQHSKCCEESNPPRVRIPDSPPQSSAEAFCRALFVLISHAEGRFRTDCIASAEVSFDSYSKCA